MTLRIELGALDGRQVLTLSGRLNGSTAPDLERWLAEQPAAPLIWDLSALDFVSSAGIRVLIVHEKRVRLSGQTTILVGMTAPVLEVLRMTGIAAFWTLVPTLADLGSLVPASATEPRDHRDDEASLSTAGGDRFTITRYPKASGTIIHWHDGDWTGASLSTLGVAFGRGGLGVQKAVAAARPMHFAALTRSLNVALSDGECDVLPIADPATTFVRVDEAWSLRGDPQARLRVESETTPEQLLEAMRAATGAAWNAALLVLPPTRDDSGPSSGAALVLAVSPPHTAAPWIACRIALVESELDPAIIASYAALVEALPSMVGEDMVEGLPALIPAGAVAYCWGSAAPTDAAACTLRITYADGERERSDETELIVRVLYADCRQVTLTRLTGGYSASTWQVESFDALGRRLLPTVLKVGPASMMQRENDAHERYVRPFILNNASVGMGMATQGESVGLRYNFLGVTGDSAQLQTLARRWSAEPAERMHGLYETVARRTLAPWYGQARITDTALYVDHTPLRLFPGLVAAAREVLPFDVAQPVVWCEPLACELPNPWWFLTQVFPQRRHERVRCPRAITHGDLNLNNILSDERDNLYVIDFSETRERSAGSDFARSESVFLLLQRPLADDPDAAGACLRDIQRLYDMDRAWHEVPPDVGGLHAEDVAFIGRLRTLAREHLGDDAPAEAYLLPVFEWTLPMAAWPNLPRAVRELSTWVAALQVARIEAARR